MGGDARVPNKGVSIDEGGKGAISKQEVNPARMDRPAANASGLGADINPLGGHQGIKAVELLKLHVKIPTDQTRNPPGGLGVDEGIPAQSASVQKAVGGPMCIAIDIVQPKGITAS
jgi:hypothetical protein